MPRDEERVRLIREALCDEGLQAIVCALPANVLLLTGYWPVVGTSMALVTRDGYTALLAPEDERELAAEGWADEVRTFRPASLDDLRSAEEAIRQPLAETAKAARITGGRVGYERSGEFEPASYAALHLYGSGILDLLGTAFPAAALTPVDPLLARLRSVKTPREVGRIRTACRIAGEAFAEGRRQLHAGQREAEVAACFGTPLGTRAEDRGDVRRGGFAYCMSGVHSAQASGAYARTRERRIQPAEFVLVHCNSYADGFWTDITRTYCVGQADEHQRRLYEAVREARSAALAAIRPGVAAAAVDRAAREVFRSHGFAKEFKHSTGHGVGFAAINHNARPRLHPVSDDVLQVGMVFNVEPALYFEGRGGLRHCDVVVVTPAGAEVLTPFHVNREELVVP